MWGKNRAPGCEKFSSFIVPDALASRRSRSENHEFFEATISSRVVRRTRNAHAFRYAGFVSLRRNCSEKRKFFGGDEADESALAAFCLIKPETLTRFATPDSFRYDYDRRTRRLHRFALALIPPAINAKPLFSS